MILLPGTSVRAVSHASGAPIAREATPTQNASTTRVPQRLRSARIGEGARVVRERAARRAPLTLRYASQPSGSAISTTSASAAASQTGSDAVDALEAAPRGVAGAITRRRTPRSAS